MTGSEQTLVLALGNDLLGDDGVGLLAARELAGDARPGVTVEESGEAGLALVELLSGYANVLLLDAMVTGRHAPGAIVEFSPADFRKVVAPSPHYAGLPEVLELARRLEIPFPARVQVLAMEVLNPYDFQPGLSPAVAAALPAYLDRARAFLDSVE